MQEGEDAVQFANRVKAAIAAQGGLVDLTWWVVSQVFMRMWNKSWQNYAEENLYKLSIPKNLYLMVSAVPHMLLQVVHVRAVLEKKTIGSWILIISWISIWS